MSGMNLSVYFPSGSGIPGVVFDALSWLYSGVGSYAVAIILFAVILRLIFSPLDFGSKYFQKKNSIAMAKMKPELAQIAATYADNPLEMNRQRSALMRKHGGGMAGFCLFSVINIVMVFVIFISVFQALGTISNYNVHRQFVNLRTEFHNQIDIKLDYLRDGWISEDYASEFPSVAYIPATLGANEILHYTYDDGGVLGVHNPYEEVLEWILENPYLVSAMQAEFRRTSTGFLWVANIWRSDTPWTSQVMGWNAFRGAAGNNRILSGDTLTAPGYGVEESAEERSDRLAMIQTEYNMIFANISGRSWNGLLFLILLAGATSFLSIWLMSKMTAKVKTETKKVEEEAGYGVRRTTTTDDGKQVPSLDPASMNKVMKFIFPVIMVVFTMMATAALAVYIIAGAVVQTSLGFAFNFIIDKIIKRQEKKKAERGEAGPDKAVINPHAKYFKGKGRVVNKS